MYQTAENCQYCCREWTDRKVQLVVCQSSLTVHQKGNLAPYTELLTTSAEHNPSQPLKMAKCLGISGGAKEEFPTFKGVQNIG